MNISYNWLKEYLDFDLAPAQVSEALTSIGLETDGLEEVESEKCSHAWSTPTAITCM